MRRSEVKGLTIDPLHPHDPLRSPVIIKLESAATTAVKMKVEGGIYSSSICPNSMVIA